MLSGIKGSALFSIENGKNGSMRIPQEQFKNFDSIFENVLPLGILLIHISPEVLRWVECLYFVILRQNRRWSKKSILLVSLVEGIDAVVVSLLVFKVASQITPLQFASFGYLTILPIALMKSFGHRRQPGGSNSSSPTFRVMYCIGAILHLGGFGTLIWSLVREKNSKR